MDEKPRMLKCFICEKELECVREDSIGQVYGGGEVSLHFNFGSRKWDCICFRQTFGNGEFTEIDFGDGKGPFQVEKACGSKPKEEFFNSPDRAMRLASCSHIIGVICDECFEKKAHLLQGYEKGNGEFNPVKDARLKLVIE